MPDKSKYALRLLTAAIAYRQWSLSTVVKWAEAWSVDAEDLRDALELLIKDTDRRVEGGK